MNVGKTLFAQVMEFVPWKAFGRIIERDRGDAGVRRPLALDCAHIRHTRFAAFDPVPFSVAPALTAFASQSR
jgi:hypothetical protein